MDRIVTRVKLRPPICVSPVPDPSTRAVDAGSGLGMSRWTYAISPYARFTAPDRRRVRPSKAQSNHRPGPKPGNAHGYGTAGQTSQTIPSMTTRRQQGAHLCFVSDKRRPRRLGYPVSPHSRGMRGGGCLESRPDSGTAMAVEATVS